MGLLQDHSSSASADFVHLVLCHSTLSLVTISFWHGHSSLHLGGGTMCVHQPLIFFFSFKSGWLMATNSMFLFSLRSKVCFPSLWICVPSVIVTDRIQQKQCCTSFWTSALRHQLLPLYGKHSYSSEPPCKQSSYPEEMIRWGGLGAQPSLGFWLSLSRHWAYEGIHL